MKDHKFDFKCLAGPVLVLAAGLMLIIVYAPTTEAVNRMVGLGFLALCAGTFWMLFALYTEYDKTGKDLPEFLNKFFPNYPVVEDRSDLTRLLSGFRRSYSDFLSGEFAEQNSTLQNYATQLMWHSAALQKKRLMKKNLTIEMDSVRRAYTGRQGCLRQNSYFDGRYQVNDIYEEISALRIIKQGARTIRRIRDNEVAHFTLLSAKQSGEARVICPNCGNKTTRENLLDGCDYCGTKFTVEDMKNKVDSFGLRRDFRTSASKKEAVKELAYPWITLAVLLPPIYFSIIGAFVYMPGTNIFMRLLAGLLSAGLLGLLAWSLKAMVLTLCVPFILLAGARSESLSRKMIYSRAGEEEQEKQMAGQVRKRDPLFSLQSFFGGVQNKLSAIHFADLPAEINAFSENDMSPFLEKYKDVVDVDILDMKMDSYTADKKLQTAAVSARLSLMEHDGRRIRKRTENLKLTMTKDAGCRTQAVCGASVLKCKGCGASLSLMEGKTCSYCGRNLDLRQYDWIIDRYEILKS